MDNVGISEIHLMIELQESSSTQMSKLKCDSPDELYEHFLKDIYYAEKKIDKSLPKMIKHASDPKLKSCLRITTRRQSTRSSGWRRCLSSAI